MNGTVQETLDALSAIRWDRFPDDADAQDWESVFTRLLPFLQNEHAPAGDEGRPERTVSDEAAERLGAAIESEAGSRYIRNFPTVAEARRRLTPVLAAIADREARYPGAVEAFAHGVHLIREYHPVQRVLLLDWLETLRAAGGETPGLVIAEARLWRWGDRAHAVVKPLTSLLDHPDALVRAVAANELGSAMGEYEGVDRRETWGEAMAAVGGRELVRPGVAAAFIWGLPYDARTADGPEQLGEWVLDLLLRREGAEPEVPYFNSLEFVACDDLMGASPKWAKRLLAAGREDLAAWAATEGQHPVRGMRPLLERFTSLADDVLARGATWLLASAYRVATGEGLRRGFVREYNGHPAFDAFIVFDVDEPVHPRIVSLYPKRPRRAFLRDTVRQAVDAVVPSAMRGQELPKRWSFGRDGYTDREFQNRVYVTYTHGTGPAVLRCEIVGNGISGEGWDPEALMRADAAARP